jgi:hypothetical protein
MRSRRARNAPTVDNLCSAVDNSERGADAVRFRCASGALPVRKGCTSCTPLRRNPKWLPQIQRSEKREERREKREERRRAAGGAPACG